MMAGISKMPWGSVRKIASFDSVIAPNGMPFIIKLI